MISKRTVSPISYKLYSARDDRFDPSMDVCDITTNDYPPAMYGLNSFVEGGEEYVRLGVVTKSDGVAATPWSFYKQEIANKESKFTMTQTRITYPKRACGGRESELTFDGSAIAPIGVNDIRITDFDDKLKAKVDSVSIVKAQANLRKAMANIPMLYKERKMTVKTVGVYSRAILNNVITMQRRDLKKWIAAVKRHKNRPDRLKKIANSIADRHLEFVFGVMPVLDDILGLCDFITAENRTFRTGRGKHTDVTTTSTYRTLPLGLGGAVSQRRQKYDRYSVRTGLRYDIVSTIFDDASRLGFNPIYYWYDATPLSFVVGWFSNLNHWLASLESTPGVVFRTGYSTKRAECTINQEVKGLTKTEYGSKKVVSGECSSTGSSVMQNRVVHGTEPGLQPWYFIDNASFFAAAATVSLTVQRLVKTGELEIAKKPFRYRGKRPRNLPPIQYRKG